MLENLQPQRPFYYFEELTKIPRPSYHEEKIAKYIADFAKKRGLEHYTDEYMNVIIIKEASAGYENEAPLILQGHTDMVCEKERGVEIDFENDSLDIFIDGDFIKARGTTLGGDDGVAVAYMLALLDDETLNHPRLECVFTTAEEVGMDGARGLSAEKLKGKMLLNLDSEEEGEVLASCAGGGQVDISLTVERETEAKNPYKILVSGLLGGHSGTEIDKGRANASKLMIRILKAFCDEDVVFGLAELFGGEKDNAIPTYSESIVDIGDLSKAADIVSEFEKVFKEEFKDTDSDIKLEITKCEYNGKVLSDSSTKKVILLCNELPTGIIKMSEDIENFVQTSLNMGILALKENTLDICFSIRSSKSSDYGELSERVCKIAKKYGAETKQSGEYPAWEWLKNSPLRDKLQSIYKDIFGKELVIKAIHAGVECGLLSKKISGLDAVSMGPNLYDIHTPRERLSISSFARTYEFVKAIIEAK